MALVNLQLVNIDKRQGARKSPILDSLNCLFYVSKLFGAIPYSLTDFIKRKRLALSSFGSVFCVVSCVLYITAYHVLMSETMLERDSESSIGTLTAVIGIFIIYLEPFMMSVDILAALVNQQSLIELFERLDAIDQKLERENVYLNYGAVRRASVIFIGIFFVGEMSIGLVTVLVFEEAMSVWQALWWFASCLPLFVNSVAKTWFLVLILLVRQRLRAINAHLDAIKTCFVERKLHHVDGGDGGGGGKTLKRDNLFMDSVGYLEQEIYSIRQSDMSAAAWSKKGKFSIDVNNFRSKKIIKVQPYRGSGNSIGEKMDVKLINLCRAHDEICDIAKQLNRLFSVQMLITMAYGFIFITAQFYFMYCGLLKQTIPILFRTANDIGLTIASIVYTAYKCVVVIYISWKTKIDSQKTGVQLHKIANVVDKNHLYNVCNHLSLKLLNHHLNFTACGFFDLDMETIYAISGAITSYLIILIQFNLAAKRPATAPNDSANNNATTMAALMTTTPFALRP